MEEGSALPSSEDGAVRAWRSRLFVLVATPAALCLYTYGRGYGDGLLDSVGFTLLALMGCPFFLLQLFFTLTFIVAVLSMDDLALVIHGTLGMLAAIGAIEAVRGLGA